MWSVVIVGRKGEKMVDSGRTGKDGRKVMVNVGSKASADTKKAQVDGAGKDPVKELLDNPSGPLTLLKTGNVPLLREVYESGNADAYGWIARNPNTPSEIADEIALGGFGEDSQVSKVAAQVGNISPECAKDILTNSEDPVLRLAVSSNPAAGEGAAGEELHRTYGGAEENRDPKSSPWAGAVTAHDQWSYTRDALHNMDSTANTYGFARGVVAAQNAFAQDGDKVKASAMQTFMQDWAMWGPGECPVGAQKAMLSGAANGLAVKPGDEGYVGPENRVGWSRTADEVVRNTQDVGVLQSAVRQGLSLDQVAVHRKADDAVLTNLISRAADKGDLVSAGTAVERLSDPDDVRAVYESRVQDGDKAHRNDFRMSVQRNPLSPEHVKAWDGKGNPPAW